jgi:DNA repair protein SbcC/Rad50
MRPVRLTMQAFGPYADREVIDFREAVEAGLFGIYGQTGSGKSSIFSAMTFALFGEAAKSEQDAPSLRSDHADASVATEVELVFDIGERRYVVLRRPDQMRPKQRGEGETLSHHEAFLFDATGLALDDLNDVQRGKIIAEKKVRTVDQAIEDMLGYGPEQFRQIVLLPQGRFETFLSAKTKERLEILRDLFDVSLYRSLTAKLKADAEAVERLVRNVREVCASRLAAENFESTDALIAGIADAGKQHAEQLAQEKAARTALEAVQKVLQEGQTTEAKFKAAEDAQKAFAELQEGKGDMEALGERVRMAEQARSLLDVESAVNEAVNGVLEAEAKLKTAQDAATSANKKAVLAADALKQEQDRAGEIVDLDRQVQELKRHTQVLEKAEDLTKAVEDAQAAEQYASGKLQEAQHLLTEHQGKHQAKIEAVKTARQTEGRHISITARLTELKAALVVAEAFEKATTAVEASETTLATLMSDYETAKSAEEAARAKFEAAERGLSETQALHLASKLSDGEPCPVCGATEHPALATGAIEHAGQDKAFRDAKASWQKADQAAREAGHKLAGIQSVIKERQTHLDGLQRPTKNVATTRDLVSAEQEVLDGLELETDIAAADAEIEQLTETMSGLEAKRDQLRGVDSKRQRTTASATARLEEMLRAVPEKLRDADALADATKTTSSELTERRKVKEAAEKVATKTREAAIGASKEDEAATKALGLCNESHSRAEATFSSRLEQAGLSREIFAALKPAIETIEEDRGTVEEYRRKLEITEETVLNTADAIRDLVRPKLAEIESQQGEAEEKFTMATNRRAGAEHLLGHLKGLRDELAETLCKLDEEEAASGPLRTMAALMNGDNPQKLDLETFAIGAMFDQVLEAANLRLGPMTVNRYRLERDREGVGRGRRGLGIQIFDTFTGKTRPTATLSGGETFIAALALALGLADIVESASGKLRLDTIFIDEGFGSLDTENGSGTLDQVLQVLSSLVSQNRAVGLISHVPLVQETIPNGFYVRKHLAGSSVEARGLV